MFIKKYTINLEKIFKNILLNLIMYKSIYIEYIEYTTWYIDWWFDYFNSMQTQ